MLETLLSHATEIAGAIAMLVGLVWHHNSAGNTDSWREQLKAVAQSFVHDYVGDIDDPEIEAKIRAYVSAKAKTWLVEHKVPNGVADLLVLEAIEVGVTELKRMLSQQAALREKWEAMTAAAAKVADALKPPANPTVPKLDLDIEIVKPDAPPPPPESSR